MYLDHYGLREPPFSITPDPRFVFLSERHRDALAHLLYGIGQGGGSGFVQLTGEVGTGKTTLSRLLLEQLPANARVALILNPLLSPVELLEAVCEELHIAIDGRRGNLKALVDALNAHLLEAHATGLRVVLIVDEAQNLSPAALEQIRLLTNLETATQKLLQIILLGQPELREQLARPELRQLAQRITARYHLDPLDSAESEAYLRHRWAVAGGGAFPFAHAAVRRLHRRASGIPRLLNVIAERALLAGYARGERVVGERLLDEAANEVLAPRTRSRRWILPVFVVATALAAWVTVDRFESHRWPSKDVAPTHAHGAATAARPAVAPAKVQPARHSPTAITVPPAVTASPPPPIDDGQFATWLNTTHVDTGLAWARLIALWSIRPDDIDSASPSPCPAFKAPGLFCTNGRQRLSLLAQFDRPVLLKLRAGGHPAWAVLLGLGTTQGLVQVDGGTLTVHRSALEDVLEGYTMIGRGPRELVLPIRHGDTGPGVDWLRHRLLPTSASSPEPTARGSFDDALVAAVRLAQRDFGLRPDGVVGPETLLALMASDPDGPHLRKLQE
ncbi:MAG TPA: AAA family ATPase [Xanthomonadaceae bacterium]|nr:AAA family ATPase [Xanthomonadaceae bacterium]